MSKRPVIHWFRRDLRLEDNLALHAALGSNAPVLPLYVFDPAILRSPNTGAARLAFMLGALADLDDALRRRGSRLVIHLGDPAIVLAQMVAETGATALFFNRDYSPFARRRDEKVVGSIGIPVHSFDDALLAPPGDVMKPDGQPYTVYTPFMKAWKKLPKLTPMSDTGGRFATEFTDTGMVLPTLRDLGFAEATTTLSPTGAAAERRLDCFMEGPVYSYGHTRNGLTPEPFDELQPMLTAVLSPYLRFGLVSPRRAYQAARQAFIAAPDEAARSSVETWVNEIVWREFYMHILYHFPHVVGGNFRREYDSLAWRDAPDELDAWKAGRTGYPVVDAAMRQLATVGWLPNRARMIAASFLTKDLLIDWREGERHFIQHLIDGDPAANNGGWQWTAGTGTDAQPYFRIFNPVSQSQKFDPDGVYIRHWIPELRAVPDAFIHEPWQMPQPPVDYPPPIVDHDFARERVLAVFGAVKKD